jgi:hypothetical protein
MRALCLIAVPYIPCGTRGVAPCSVTVGGWLTRARGDVITHTWRVCINRIVVDWPVCEIIHGYQYKSPIVTVKV